MKVGAFCLVATLALAVVAIVYLNSATDRQVEEYLREIEANGAITRYDLLPPPRPRPSGADSVDPNGDAGIRFLFELNEHLEALVQRGTPESDEFYRLVSLLLSDQVVLSEEGLSDDDRHAAEEILAKYEHVLDAAKVAARYPPATQQGLAEALRMQERPIYKWPLPNLLATRGVASLLAIESMLMLEAGRANDALTNCEHILRLANHEFDIPTLITNMMGVALVKIGVDCSMAIARDGHLSAESAQQFLKALTSVDRQQAFYTSLSGEIMTGIDIWRREMSVPDGSTGVVGRLYASNVLRFWRNWDLLLYCYFHHAMYEATVASGGIGGPDFDREIAAILQMQAQYSAYPLASAASGVLPDFGRAVKTRAQYESEVGLARVSYALILFQIENGGYPSELGELVPRFLDELPLDPFAHAEFHYELSGGGFRLYGVGVNGEDDGGVHDRTEGDLVWDVTSRGGEPE